MYIVVIILLIFIIIGIILLWGASTYNKFQEFIIRSNAVEADIDSTLRKRYDLLNKSISIIKSSAKEDSILENIANLKSKKLSNFDLDRQLYSCINEFNEFKNKYEDLKQNEEFIKIDTSLRESEIEIGALRSYYNNIITDYNKYVKTFPSLFVAIILRYKKKPYYDGKNMDDEIINDFRL